MCFCQHSTQKLLFFSLKKKVDMSCDAMHRLLTFGLVDDRVCVCFGKCASKTRLSKGGRLVHHWVFRERKTFEIDKSLKKSRPTHFLVNSSDKYFLHRLFYSNTNTHMWWKFSYYLDGDDVIVQMWWHFAWIRFVNDIKIVYYVCMLLFLRFLENKFPYFPKSGDSMAPGDDSVCDM